MSSCLILLFIAGLFISGEIFEQKQLANGIKQLEARQNEEAIQTFEKVLDKDESNEVAKSLLEKAKKIDFKEKTQALNKAYKIGEMEEVERLAEEILAKYETDPILGSMTDKIVYTKSKALISD